MIYPPLPTTNSKSFLTSLSILLSVNPLNNSSIPNDPYFFLSNTLNSPAISYNDIDL